MIKTAGADTRPADHQEQSEVIHMTDFEIKIKDIEHRINETIEFAAKDYKENGASIWGNNEKYRIYGMIEVLKILTGKDYYFDANGLHERKA